MFETHLTTIDDVEEGFLELPPILLLFGIGHLDVSFDALDGRVGE